MARTEEEKQRIHEAQRAKILSAASKVFARKGMAATMDDVATEAEVSHGLAYRYFANKEALFRAVVRSRGQLLLERLEDALAGISRLRDKIDVFVQALISFVEEHWAFFAIYLQTTSGFTWNTGRLGQDAIELQSILEREVIRALEGAIESGEIAPEDPELYACLLLGTLQRYVARWGREGGSAVALWQRAEPLSRMLVRALGGR